MKSHQSQMLAVSTVLLALLSCRPVFAIGWGEFILLVILIVVLLGPLFFRFFRFLSRLQQIEKSKDKQND